jgi:hypothetical protein
MNVSIYQAAAAMNANTVAGGYLGESGLQFHSEFRFPLADCQPAKAEPVAQQ